MSTTKESTTSVCGSFETQICKTRKHKHVTQTAANEVEGFRV
jgi:hypothetical protein